MKTSKVFIMAAFAAFATTASAQFANTSNSSSGLRGGGGAGISIENDCNSYSRFSVGYMGVKFKEIEDGTSYSDDDDNLKGFTLGYTRGISLSTTVPVFFEIGGQLNYATWSDSDSDDGLKYTNRLNFLALSVPLNLSYKLSFNNGLYLAPYAGIHFDLGLLLNEKETLKYKSEKESESFNYYSSDDMDDETFNRFQMGYQVGVNLGVKKFNIGVGYKASFLPIYKEDDFKVQTGGPIITVGYNF